MQQRTVKIPLNLDAGRFLPLFFTAMEVFNIHVDFAFQNKSVRKTKAHGELYHKLRRLYPDFPSSLLQSTRDSALTVCKSTKFKFKPKKQERSSIIFNLRNVSLRGNLLTFSTLNKREKVLIKIPKYFQGIVDTWKFTGMQLVIKNNKLWAHLTFKSDAPKILKNKKVLGIDRGIKNIIYCSDGTCVSGKEIIKIKRKYAYNRKTLQAKGTRSAKRKLRSQSGREKRFSLDENHKISKQLVNLPYTTFALEDLSGIRKRKKTKFLNRIISNWSYYQLEQFLLYKAIGLGKEVIKVDARYTSQKCNVCKSTSKNNRKKELFKCIDCGNEEHADYNASLNIRDLGIAKISKEQGVVNHPNISSL